MIKCIYHSPCLDGFAALLAVKIKFGPDKVEGIPANYKRTKIENILEKSSKDDDVIIVDFSFSRSDLLRLNDRVNSLIVLDHHETAEKQLSDLDFCFFDESKSGCTIAWEYFNSNLPVPLLFMYIQDRWRKEFLQTEFVISALGTYPLDESLWINNFLSTKEEKHWINEFITVGKSIQKYKNKIVSMFVEMDNAGNLQIVYIKNYPVPVVNSSCLCSEIGNALAKKYPFVIVYFDDPKLRNFELRSSDENPHAVNVAIIAEEFGGGGHYHAAGFRVEKKYQTLKKLGLWWE